MKYMTFNSSCAFAGVANMLLQFGVDAEDREIAMGMKLPYLFERQEGAYIAGPMLQESRWFNLYLNTLGYAMCETAVDKGEIVDYLSRCKTAMLGLHVSPDDKHAVVYVGSDSGNLLFLNNKHKESDSPERICLSGGELSERLDDTVMVAEIKTSVASTPDFLPLYRRSCEVLELLKEDIQVFCNNRKTKEEISASMNTLFRATLLDGITMLELLGRDTLAERFRKIQRELLNTIRIGEPAVLSEKLDVDNWLGAIDEYKAIIRNKAGEK